MLVVSSDVGQEGTSEVAVIKPVSGTGGGGARTGHGFDHRNCPTAFVLP